MLKIESISKKFVGNDFYSLKDVSMEINKGEIVGLIGRNGAGKSTHEANGKITKTNFWSYYL